MKKYEEYERKMEQEEQEQTEAIFRGEAEMLEVFDLLAAWVSKTFGIDVINITYRDRYNPNYMSSKLTLTLKDYEQLEKMEDIKKGGWNSKYERQIVDKLKHILAAGHKHPYEMNTDDMDVFYDDFRSYAWGKTFSQISLSQWQELAAMDETIWEISPSGGGYVVFYYTEDQVKKNKASGLDDRIRQQFIALYKSYDEYGFWSADDCCLTFDSKEILDNEYEGNMLYYDR